MFCSKCDNFNSINELLKMSLVPPACQECQLNADGSTQSEKLEWLLDLKNKAPIWSPLLDINTSGFRRKLPLSMTKNYNIEIEGRLWSLWGSKRRLRKHHKKSKSYMAITVMALCAARVLRLNAWNIKLMDIFQDNGRKFFKESLKQAQCCCKDFQLKHLINECNLEGIHFSIRLKTVQKGDLFSPPLKCQTNLAFALIHFFDRYQFGLLKCCARLLGFGFIDGPQGGYFMYDAQTFENPIFAKNYTAPYLLRTNHLQVLLYCLVVSLNVCQSNTGFSLHHVEISVKKPFKSKIPFQPSNSCMKKYPRIIPSELWKTPENQYIKAEPSTTEFSENPLKDQSKNNEEEKETQHEPLFKKKYRRKIHNIKKEEVEQSPIKPLVDADQNSDEDLQLKQDFVRMICSETVLPQTAADSPDKMAKDFSCNLLDALMMGPKTCLIFKDL